MSLLTGGPTLTYNGVQFNSTQLVSVSLRYVEDKAGRTVTNTILTLKVKAKVADGATQDVTLAALKIALERPGQALVYTGAGFGGLSINTAGGNRDLNWGPKPRVLEWHPIGRDYAAEITWQVEVSLIGCANAPFQGRVMEATYGLSLSTDDGGYATRVHSGFIRIPMTRTTAGAVPDTADNYFEDWVPLLLPGYRRTISRNLDPSHSQLDFTVTDAERAGHPLPPGVVNATGGHTMTSEGKTVSVLWGGSISMTYELARDFPRSAAWEYFLQLCEDRVRAEFARGAILFLPTSMTITEPEIHGKNGAAFTLNYRIAFGNGGGVVVNRAFPLHGLWRGPPNATWEKHSDSLANSAQHPRGLDRLQHDSRTDRIVDLCGNERELRGVVMGRNQALKNVPIDPKWAEVKRRLRIADNPPPESTWLGYESKMVLEPHDRVAHHIPLPDRPMPVESVLRAGAFLFPQRDPPFTLRSQFSPGAITQPIASPVYYVRVIGRGVRYAYEVSRPRPGLIGATVTEANDPRMGNYWSQWIGAVTTGNIYCAEWDLRYFIARPLGSGPALLPVLPHPFIQEPLPLR